MTFHLMFVHYTFSLVWVAEWPHLGKSCPFSWPCVLIVFCLFSFFPFGFESAVWFLARLQEVEKSYCSHQGRTLSHSHHTLLRNNKDYLLLQMKGIGETNILQQIL